MGWQCLLQNTFIDIRKDNKCSSTSFNLAQHDPSMIRLIDDLQKKLDICKPFSSVFSTWSACIDDVGCQGLNP